ncbi:MAG: trimethylamine methyltransferase family protein [Candidatus Aminicenantes bacterium]
MMEGQGPKEVSFIEDKGVKDMYDRMHALSIGQLNRIHSASMGILQKTGVRFKNQEAVEIFKKNGFRVEGDVVFFEERHVQNALDTAPASFRLIARNPDKNLTVGGDEFVFAPGYGAPFMVSVDGNQREAVMEDYHNFCKLVQTSPFMDMNGFMMVEPSDVPAKTAHLDMILSNMLLCDKPFMGSPVSRQGAVDCVEMASMVWGREKVREFPVTVSLINSLSPLAFSEEMSASLIELSRSGQACIVAPLIMAGTSGPITLAGTLALQNAEVLAGLTLAQLVRPGAPVVYGTASAPTDMRTGVLSIGAPELSVIVSCTAQIARFYKLPSRGGGCLTDSHVPDMQAGVQSAVGLVAAVRAGINFILHAAGIQGSYIAMSYEKFLIDEELCGAVRKMVSPVQIDSAALQEEVVARAGIGGEYLSQLETVNRCRTEFFFPWIMQGMEYESWRTSGGMRTEQKAGQVLKKRLQSYQKPNIGRNLEAELSRYVARRKES